MKNVRTICRVAKTCENGREEVSWLSILPRLTRKGQGCREIGLINKRVYHFFDDVIFRLLQFLLPIEYINTSIDT